MTQQKETEILILTGMSGAGKSVAIRSFEDLGYYCVDNLPPALLPKFINLMKNSQEEIKKVALVMDLRGRAFFETLSELLQMINEEESLDGKIIYFDATDETLVSRYKETRRAHPLSDGGLLLDSIQAERRLLQNIKNESHQIIDTTRLKPKELRERIVDLYARDDQDVFSIHFVSFGFKYGAVIDADLVFDVRFLPNPFYVPSMRPLTGLDQEVKDYVFKWSDTQTFIEKLLDLLAFILPQYKKEGKSQLVIAIGCTGGQHRSVALSEYFINQLKTDYKTHITHRDIEKRKGH